MISNTRFWGIRPDYVILHYYIGGVIEIYYNITWGGGGLPDLLQYYKGEGGGLSGPQICIT